MKLIPHVGMIATSVRTNRDAAYYSPVSIRQFIAMATTAEPPVAVVAGGTDICAQCNEGADFGSLIDISGIGDLKTVAVADGMLRIGSALSLFEAGHHLLVMDTLPGFAAALRAIANVRIRFRATLGGNIMARRPRYEMAILALAARATLRLHTRDGMREQSIDEFLRSPTPAGCLLECLMLPARGWLGFSYDRSLRPAMTLCVSAYRSADRIVGRAAIATEHCLPLALDVDLGQGLTSRSDTDEIAERAFEALPDSFSDVVLSNWYIRRAGKALLARQLRELADG